MAYKLTAQERELQISVCDDETELCITSSSVQYSSKLKKIALALGLKVIRLGNSQTIRVFLPRECLLLRAPRKAKKSKQPMRKSAKFSAKTPIVAEVLHNEIADRCLDTS